jgi:hypothetical protein
MSLTIETGRLIAENINHPDDIYIYFENGYVVWHWTDAPLSVYYKGYLFTFVRADNTSPSKVRAAFNEWVTNPS